MNENDGAKPSTNLLLKDAALSWSIRMRGEVTRTLQEEFDQWRTASPDHQRAYDRYSRVIDRSEILKNSKQLIPSATEKPVERQPRRWLMAGAAAAAVIVFAIAISASDGPFPGSGDVLSARAAEPLVTGRGEIRSFVLDDGSTATLDTDTKVEVSMFSEGRYLRLVQGRARLKVIKDPRQFRIAAGEGVVTTKEAVVDISLRDDRRVVVELINGNAELASASPRVPPATRPIPLRRSAALEYGADDKQIRSSARDRSNSSREWPSGWAEHGSIRLDSLLSEASRYSEMPITVDDPTIASRTVSGRFKISDTEMFVSRIVELFGLTVDRRADGIHLRSQ